MDMCVNNFRRSIKSGTSAVTPMTRRLPKLFGGDNTFWKIPRHMMGVFLVGF